MLFSLLLRCVLLAVGGAFFMLLFMAVVWLVMDEIVSCMSKDIFSVHFRAARMPQLDTVLDYVYCRL